VRAANEELLFTKVVDKAADLVFKRAIEAAVPDVPTEDECRGEALDVLCRWLDPNTTRRQFYDSFVIGSVERFESRSHFINAAARQLALAAGRRMKESSTKRAATAESLETLARISAKASGELGSRRSTSALEVDLPYQPVRLQVRKAAGGVEQVTCTSARGPAVTIQAPTRALPPAKPTCAECGFPIAVPVRGPTPRFCGSTCRSRNHRAKAA
jgi:hypothetical protein